jgi:nitric oxide reductase subunit B
MAQRNFMGYLLNPRNWWLPLLVIFVVSAAGVTMIGVHTYTEAPPIPDYITEDNKVVFTKDDVLAGQAVFQQNALMEYGSMFGDGANRGPDFTAEALHMISLYMNEYYAKGYGGESRKDIMARGFAEQVKAEIKNNRYRETGNSVTLNKAQDYATKELINFYTKKFSDPASAGSAKSVRFIGSNEDIRTLTSFFYWGAWVCGVQRPVRPTVTHIIGHLIRRQEIHPVLLWSSGVLLALLV